MKEKSSARNITEQHREEARLLLKIWEDTYDERKRLGLHTQGAFGQEYSIGNQAAVGFFLHAKTALSLKAAKGFAKGLGCQIADFSARLAELETAWPFELVDRERYEALPAAQKHRAQLRMQDEIDSIEAMLQANGTHR